MGKRGRSSDSARDVDRANRGSSVETPVDAVKAVLSKRVSNLWAYLGGAHAHEFCSFTVRYRGPSDFIAVLKIRRDVVFDAQVCFGNGASVVGALVALGTAIAQGKWKADKPWNGGG